jgi:hypothetical protein
MGVVVAGTTEGFIGASRATSIAVAPGPAAIAHRGDTAMVARALHDALFPLVFIAPQQASASAQLAGK